jgi:hypothetical protein
LIGDAAKNRWVDDPVAAILRQNCTKTSGHTFSGTQIHAPEKVCHNGSFSETSHDQRLLGTSDVQQ